MLLIGDRHATIHSTLFRVPRGWAHIPSTPYVFTQAARSTELIRITLHMGSTCCQLNLKYTIVLEHLSIQCWCWFDLWYKIQHNAILSFKSHETGGWATVLRAVTWDFTNSLSKQDVQVDCVNSCAIHRSSNVKLLVLNNVIYFVK